MVVLALVACRLGPAAARANEPALLPPVECRVESEIFAGDGKEPVSRSLTLLADRVAWDFLGPADLDDDGDSAEAAEFVLHDPDRQRVAIVDPKRNVKTTIATKSLSQLSASLTSWARKADDEVVRWAGGTDFADGFDTQEKAIELHGPRVRYAVAFDEAPSPEAAAAYRKFADTAILLKALMQPGGLPPFPRIAINEKVAAAGGIPREVSLEVDSSQAGSALAASGIKAGMKMTAKRLRSVHKFHPRWIESDHKRVEAASARIAVAREVPLAEYARKLQ
jgi:hypothetical protein